MNKNVTLAIAVGAGVVGLVLVHAFMSGQSAGASAVQMGATISGPFAITTDVGGTTNAVTVDQPAAPTLATSTSNAGSTVTTAIQAAPPNIGLAGWGAALGGMADLASGLPPWGDPTIAGSAYVKPSAMAVGPFVTSGTV